jgi:hypothetical protein
VLFSTFSGVIALSGDARAAVAEARCKKEPPRAIDCFYERFNKAKIPVWYRQYPDASSVMGSFTITKKVYLTGNHESLA